MNKHKNDPSFVNLRTRDLAEQNDLPEVELVDTKERQSEIIAKPDKAAEICGKTPRGIVINQGSNTSE